MKKLTILLLSLALVMALAGCKSENNETEFIENSKEVEIIEETETPEVEVVEEIETPEVEEDPQEIKSPEVIVGEDLNVVTEDGEPVFRVEWAYDVISEIPKYSEYTAKDSVPEARIVFIPYKVIKDFKILNIEFVEASEDGKIVFATQEVYKEESLTPDKSLLANLSFFGTIPNNGISYVDDSETTHYFTVNISGKDGSLILDRFTPAENKNFSLF